MGNTDEPEHEQSGRVYRRGTINDRYCTDILLDTGATKTLVRRELVSEEDFLGGEITIRCAHGDVVSYQLAAVKICIGAENIVVKAGVSSTLPASALLGWDIPQLMSLMGAEREGDPKPDKALAVLTRSQQRANKDQENMGQPDPNDDLQSTVEPGDPPIPQTVEDDCVFNFDASLFSPPGPTKTRLTKSQKRSNNRNYAWLAEFTPPPSILNLAADKLKTLQQEDETLQGIRDAAEDNSSNNAGGGFFYRDGIIYRRYRPPKRDNDSIQDIEQLVLPIQCRQTVIRLAHDIPLAGHLGKHKTLSRIQQRFHWPGMFRQVKEHCKSCEQCQKSSPRGTAKAPLVPLLVMEEPFKRIAMDIVGPLPRSRSGKRFVLVICDYATQYPEAVALRTIDANAVAEELVKFFTRVGVPEEILTDQGANFTSQLLQELYRLLHVKPIHTTPYHPQTDGLVERFNHTLKAMLKKTADEEGRNGDELLPYLLFAYREVPQASTGFSPFELLYGRAVRGPLDILKESWETSPKSSESVVSYILCIQERLAKLRNIVKENLEDAQQVQKSWYDRHARNRELQEGEQVLVLLPTSNKKLLAEWQGPYPVTRKVGKKL